MKEKSFTVFALIFLLILITITLVFLQFRTARVIEETQIQINLNKQEFLPYETLQVEILGNFKRAITENDIYLKRNNLIMPIDFYVEKINKNYYFAYATLNLVPGNYMLEIKVTTDKGIEIYKKEIKIVENNNKYYLALLNSVKNRWHLLSNKELIYSREALDGIDKSQSDIAFNEFMQRQNSFNEIEKALTLIVTTSKRNEWLIQKSKLTNYFLTLQDNKLGVYTINIKTPIELNCSIDGMHSIIGEKNISINLKDNSSLNFSFYCFKIENGNLTNISQQEIEKINVSLIKEYLGNKKTYLLSKKIENKEGHRVAYFLINKKFGSINDDKILTALALIFFYESNISQYALAYNWLEAQSNLGVIENIALAMLNDANAINYLLARQNYDGSFNSQNSFSKAEVTCLAYKANLPTKTMIYEWIKNNIVNFGTIDKASCLVFALEKQDIVGVMPGIIKVETGKNFDLYLKNYGLNKVNVTLKNLVLDLNYTTTLEKNQLKKLTITVPYLSYSKEVLQDKINVYYGNGYYSIPLIIFIRETNITKTELNESEETKIIINQTEEEANVTKPLLNVFSFTPGSINLSISDVKEVNLKIKNIGDAVIRNIVIVQSASLFGIIKNIEPSMINQLMPNEEKKVKIIFDVTDQQLKSFSGSLTIEGVISGINYKKDIPIYIEINRTITEGLKSCAELNGSICSVNEKCEGNIVASIEGACCIGKCTAKRKKPSKTVGIILFLLALITLVLAIIVILKKPRKERKIEEAIKRIQEKQKLKQEEKMFRPKI